MAVSPVVATPAQPGRQIVLAAIGAAITWYDIDVESCSLMAGPVSHAPAAVQYIWPGPVGSNLVYIATSNQGPRREGPGGKHDLAAYRLDATTRTLVQHGAPAALLHRPVHLTLDAAGRHALVAYPIPAMATVHCINADGTLGDEIKQTPDLDVGIFPHQIRMLPSNRGAILVTRGNDASRTAQEDPGALKVFDLNDGVLVYRQSIAPGNGYGFGPRHIDFDPGGRWLFAALERQNQLMVFSLQGDTLGTKPSHAHSTLKDTGAKTPETTHQLVGTVHTHPAGGVVYVANRASGMRRPEGGRSVFEGGDNSIAVFAINPQTGEPTLIQNEDTRGIHTRTFAIHPSGHMLVAAHIQPIDVREGNEVRRLPASLTTFHIGDDGKLEFVNRYDVDAGNEMQFWMGMVNLD